MAFIGLIVILPVAGVALWANFAIYGWLQRGELKETWRLRYRTHAAVGLALGVALAFFIHYHVGRISIDGFPIPIALADVQKDGRALDAEIPVVIHYGAIIADLLFGMALGVLPIAVALFFKENAGKLDERGRPTI